MVCHFHRLAVLAVALTTVSGFAVPQLFQKSQREDGATSLQEIFRLARDELEVNASSVDETLEIDDCMNFYHCIWSSGIAEFLRNVGEFRFVELSRSLPTACCGVQDLSCDSGSCPNSESQPNIGFLTGVVNWICSHQPNFYIGLDCWAADSFREDLTDCTTSNEDNKANIRQCFADTIHSFSSCSTNDQAFFIEFSNYVLDQVM